MDKSKRSSLEEQIEIVAQEYQDDFQRIKTRLKELEDKDFELVFAELQELSLALQVLIRELEEARLIREENKSEQCQ